MPRRREIIHRPVVSDPRYDSKLVAKFVNCMMHKGKKSVSRATMYEALEQIKEKTKQDPLEVFSQAVENAKPILEVRSRRVGGATYQVPVEVRPSRRQALAIRWLISFARQRKERTMAERLAGELLDAFNRTGATIKRREDTHRMAEANKAFAHYRW